MEGASTASPESISKNTESIATRLADIEQNPAQGIFGQASWPGVFNKAISTLTGKNAYETDHAEKDFKMLKQDGIASPGAMSGLQSGPSQSNIRGNSVAHITADRYVTIDADDFLVVTGLQKYHVKNNATFLYDQNRTVVVGQHYDRSVKGDSTTFVIGQSSEQYVGKRELTAPEEFEWKQMERGFSAMKLDLATLGLDVHFSAVDTHVIDAELSLIKARGGALEEVLKAQKGEGDALQVEISLEVDVKGRGDVLVDIGLGTPFR